MKNIISLSFIYDLGDADVPGSISRAQFIDNVSLSGAVIPEPSSLALTVIGLAGLIGLRRRRR